MKRRKGALGVTVALFVAGSVSLVPGPARGAFPGSNGAIAYVCGSEICVGNVDGTGQRQLTTGSTFGSDHPAWSHDGTKIAFERRQSNEKADLFVMNANGNALTQMTNTPAISETGPAWSRDGTKLVYSRDDGQQVQLAILTLASLTSQVIPGTFDGSYPSWSPDGSKIAFSSYAEGDENCEAGPCVATAEIFVVPAGGGSPVNITEHNEAHDLFPNWSPDGSKVVIERRAHPNEPQGRVLVIEASGEHDFTPWGDGNDPGFAPNAQAVTFDRDGLIYTVGPPSVDEVEATPHNTQLSGLHPDWQPCPNATCPSTAGTTQTQSATTVTATRVKKRIKANGTLDPPHPGALMTVTLFKKKNGVFAPVKTTTPAVTSEGKFATSFRRPGKGQCQVTARFPGDDDHSASEASKTLKC
jgi:Tol biopolymer transport system component